jgi:TRAP-type C4-dicarboxylate transport system permease small subunit
MANTATFFASLSRKQAVVERAMAYLGAMCVMAMMFITTVDVILRYVLNRPIQDSFELSQFLLVGLVFLGVPYLQSIRGHVNVQFLTARLSPAAKGVLGLTGHVIGLFAFAVVTWQTGYFAWQAWDRNDFTMGIVQYPLWPAKSVIPLGTGMLCLRLLMDILQDTQQIAQRHRESKTRVGSASSQ